MKKRYPHKSNVLLVNITRLGDMLQATPTIAGLKEENPDCKITVLVEKQFESICYNIPGIDEIYSLDLGMTVRSLTREGDGIVDAYEYVDKVITDLRNRNFDFCLNMSSSPYTAIILRMLNIKQNGGWRSDDEGYRMIDSEWTRLFAASIGYQNRKYNAINLVDSFRCSADVELHPNSLQAIVTDESKEFCEKLLKEEAKFTNTGPLIGIQAGASQIKRQWSPMKFVEYIRTMINQYNARIILSGSKKELKLIEMIASHVNNDNVFIAAGKTDIPQLIALLHMCDIFVTGDTGPMHVAASVKTPLIAMFFASAFAFETGPYSDGNIILQPRISCCPCNPNKTCLKPDCHDAVTPDLLVRLTNLRLQGDINELPEGFANPHRVTVYRSCFDEYGFCDLKPLNHKGDEHSRFRNAYRKVWLNDLAGYEVGAKQINNDKIAGIDELVGYAEKGTKLIDRLVDLVNNVKSVPSELGLVNQEISMLDNEIEQLGYQYTPLCILTKLFIFDKENISGTEVLELASQMKGIYIDLKRRTEKLQEYYNTIEEGDYVIGYNQWTNCTTSDTRCF